jgi:hypothetical protein
MALKRLQHKSSIIFIILFFLTFIFIVSGCGGGSGGGDGSNKGENNSDTSTAEPYTSSSITLTWDAPTSNADGSNLTDLAGYRIYYGPSPGSYTQSIDTGNSTSVVINNLSPGTWCFTVTAYDISGKESDYSNEVCKTIE